MKALASTQHTAIASPWHSGILCGILTGANIAAAFVINAAGEHLRVYVHIGSPASVQK